MARNDEIPTQVSRLLLMLLLFLFGSASFITAAAQELASMTSITAPPRSHASAVLATPSGACDGVGIFICQIGTCYTGYDGYIGCCSTSQCAARTTCIPYTAGVEQQCNMDTGGCVVCSSNQPQCVTLINVVASQYAMYCDTEAAVITYSFTNLVTSGSMAIPPRPVATTVITLTSTTGTTITGRVSNAPTSTLPIAPGLGAANSGLSRASVIGIVVAVVFIALLIGLAFFFFFRWKRNRTVFLHPHPPHHPAPLQASRYMPTMGNGNDFSLTHLPRTHSRSRTTISSSPPNRTRSSNAGMDRNSLEHPYVADYRFHFPGNLAQSPSVYFSSPDLDPDKTEELSMSLGAWQSMCQEVANDTTGRKTLPQNPILRGSMVYLPFDLPIESIPNLVRTTARNSESNSESDSIIAELAGPERVISRNEFRDTAWSFDAPGGLGLPNQDQINTKPTLRRRSALMPLANPYSTHNVDAAVGIVEDGGPKMSATVTGPVNWPPEMSRKPQSPAVARNSGPLTDTRKRRITGVGSQVVNGNEVIQS